jgi:secreted Zn-dependent insulinase-like peptidase
MILAEIAELKRMPELAQRIRNFQPPVDPIAEEMKKLQLEELRMKVAALRAKAMLDEAKAEETGSKTDMNNLDFVERETGTTHARDLERQQSQAQGNKELKIVDGLLKTKKEGERDGDIEGAIGFTALTNGG